MSALALAAFAKVHETSAGPLLVHVAQNSDDLPAICIAAMFEDGACVKMHIGGWSDDSQGWDKAFAALEMFDAAAAENFVTLMLPELAGMTTGGVA